MAFSLNLTHALLANNTLNQATNKVHEPFMCSTIQRMNASSEILKLN